MSDSVVPYTVHMRYVEVFLRQAYNRHLLIPQCTNAGLLIEWLSENLRELVLGRCCRINMFL